MSAADRRLPPFVWQSQAAMARVRHCFAGQERSTAISIYQSMTELANDARVRDSADGRFTVTRKEFAEHCGVSDRTLDRYIETFVRVGLVAVDRNVDGHGRKPSSYSLVDPSDMKPLPNRTDVTSQDVKSDHQGSEMTTPPLDGMEEEREEQAGTRAARSDLSSEIEEVWAHYVAVMRPRHTELTPDERKIIRDALKLATVDECKRAINGCAKSDFHMGQNDRRRKYNTIRHILKGKQGGKTTREQIDYFIDFAGAASPVQAGTSKIPVDLVGVPPVTRGTIHNKRSTVARAKARWDDADEYERRMCEEALTWLRDVCGHEPIIEDGKVAGWKAVAE